VADTSKTTGDGVDTVVAVPVKARKPDRRGHARATLRITVDVGGSDCRPAEEDVRVFDGGRELSLDVQPFGFLGQFDLDEPTALVDVVADAFTCASTHETFVPAVDRTAIQVRRGHTTELTLVYAPGQSSIQVTPRFAEVLDEHGRCVEPARAVPGVRFQLFVGSPEDGAPLQRISSTASPTVSFVDLPAGDVTLLAAPTASLDGRSVELRDPRNATLRINLGAGQNLVLDDRFEFAAAAGDVTVAVVDDADDRVRLAGIPVRLSCVDNGADGNPEPLLTNDRGLARFDGVAAGTYAVGLAVDPVSVAGRTWTTTDAAPAVVVTADDVRGSTVLRLVEDRHVLTGTVFGPDGNPVAHALVEIRLSPDDRDPFDTVLADASGGYEWEAPSAGRFFVTTALQNGRARTLLPAVVSSVARVDIHLDGGPTTRGGTTGHGSGGSTTNQDPTPFPLLVGNVDLTTGTAPAGTRGGGYGGGGSPAQSAGETVSSAIRDVLGYRTKTTDTKGFLTALERSFSCHQKAGHTVCTWTPRSYASTIPAGLGALTGAQASIFERAKVSADSILPLLDGLTPLAAAADLQDTDAIRNIVRSRVTDIVAELSLEGGPRTQRVDELFERLTGKLPGTAGTVVLIDVNTVGGELLGLGQRFGMLRDQVNTIAEEVDFTNFLIIVDSVASLFVTWQQTRAFFDRSPVDDPTTENDAPFLGTQLVLISRQLTVISESVRETYFAMDSVFLGPAERQTVLLTLTDEGNATTTMLLSELLDWIDRFALDEGPRLIEDAGTLGVNAFVPSIRRLSILATSAPNQNPNDPAIPPSFFTSRVLLALRQLASQLSRATDLADAVFERLGLPDVTPNGDGFLTIRRGGTR
jgi:hypothetical protein